jgi:acetyl esterase/lipase
VVVLLHGGFWRAVYGKSLMNDLAADIMARGWAAWNLEYRRLGTIPPGGWPGTFEDVAAGIDHLARMAGDAGLDAGRVVTVGHSAGGHLALWAAVRHKLSTLAPGDASGTSTATTAATPAAVKLVGAVALAPVSDLSEAWRLGLGGGVVSRLMGGGPDRYPERYAVGDPASTLPLGVPQVIVHGDRDGAVPVELSRRYAERAIAAGDRVTLVELPGVGHMELIDSSSKAWAVAAEHLASLLG